VLDGDELTLDSLQIDGNDHDASLYDATPDSLTIRGLPESGAVRGHRQHHACHPDTNTKLDGALPHQRRLLHPVRGGGLPPHHLFL
jgi:aminopeptidase N